MARYEHTPGSWHSYRNGAYIEVYDAELIEDGDQYRVPPGTSLIASVRNVGTIEATNANARLIASAPDMLDALDEADTAFATINIQADSLPPQQRKALQEAWAKVSAAMAQATGQPDRVAEANAQ